MTTTTHLSTARRDRGTRHTGPRRDCLVCAGPRLAFLLDSKVEPAVRSIEQHARLSLTARLHELNADGDLRNILESDDAGLADLVITGRAAADMGPGTYAWSVEFLQPYAVDLPRARAMAATLTRVERGLARLEERLGHPESFGAYVLRVAAVLHVKEFAAWSRRPRALMDEGDLRTWRAPVAASWLADREHEFHKEHDTEGVAG